MAWPLIRIDLDERSKDFQRIALQPGFPVLDRFAANNSVLRQWLGRFAAEAHWDEQTVRFLWRDDDDDSAPTAVLPASQEDLRGTLRAEVEALRTKLNQAVLKSPNERVLHGVMQQRLERALASGATESGSLFKVQTRGRWKLVWCWGYDRRSTDSAPLRLCKNEKCLLAFLERAETRKQCPRCGTRIKSGGALRTMAIAALLLLLVGLGFFAWDRAGRPGFAARRTTVSGLVVDAISGKPIAGATIEQTSAAQDKAAPDEPAPDKAALEKAVPDKTVSNANGEFDVAVNDASVDELQISATGYLIEKWRPSQGKRGERQRIELRGESDASGLVIEAHSDRPIPYASIRAVQPDHQGIADDVGLFLMPGLPSGTTEFEVAAEGYRTERVTQEVKPGRSENLLFSLTGTGIASGTVIDAYNQAPISGAVVKVTGFPGESTSDKDGTFRREELPGTTCRFEVTAPGYFTRDFERQLTISGTTTLRFLLRPELKTLDGIVVDSSGTPVSSASVRIPGLELPTTTSEDGTFRLGGVRQGTQHVEVAADGYPSTKLDVHVPTADGQPVRIVLSGSARLVGQVVDAVRKTPVKNAEIRLAEGRWKATSDEEGRFVIADLPAGPAVLEVIGRGYRAAQSDQKLIAGDTTVEIALRGATVLSGTVTSSFNQKPIAGADVQLEGTELTQKTDPEGRFRFEDVVAGPAVVKVMADGYQPASEERGTNSDEETVIPFKLRGSASLIGQVIADETDQPIAKAEVTIVGEDQKLMTDDQGKFSQMDWPARPIRLKVTANGFLPQEQDHDLSVANVPDAVIRLKPPHSVRGLVVDAGSDQPVSGAKVTLAGRNVSVATDAEGRFQVETPPAETYEFVVNSTGYRPQSFLEQPGANGTKAGDPAPLIKLTLQRDSDETPPASPPPEELVAEQPDLLGDTTPPPSAGEQFGPSMPGVRDPQEVEFFGIKSKAANVGFVVDFSGSMAGTRLERTKLELLRSVLDLHPKQMFYVAFFDDNMRLMLDTEKLAFIAKPVNKVRIYKWMKLVVDGGGTNPEPALEFVAKLNPQTIYLLSDGEFAPLKESLYDEFKQKSIRVNTIAMEDESGKVELSGIAARTQGRYRFVPSAPIPDLYEISLVTRLFDELLEQWIDPSTTTSDAIDAHDALIEFCNGQDFGPRRNATDAQRRLARDEWRRWWVEQKLTPQLMDRDEARLRKNLGNRNPWWRWASLETLSQKGVQDGGVFTPKIRDRDGGIRQAARRALVRLADEEDHGPPEGAGTEVIQEAFRQWSDWLRREKYIANLPKKPDDSLVHDFESPDLKLRRAALQTAAERGRFSHPEQLIKKMTDSDLRVRQSAYDALVKTAGKDLGPGDCSDLSRCAAAAKEWSRWHNAKAEGEAEKTLRLAESFETHKKNDKAREWYQKVIQKHPTTEAAAKAAEKLKSL
jgi:hypothetical protein